MKVNTTAVFALIFFLILFSGQAVNGSEKEHRLDIPNQIIRVGLFSQRGYHDFQNGEPTGGYGYDYLQQIRQYAPFSYEYYGQNSDWSNAYRLLEEGKIDLLSNVRKTPEREEKFAFSKYSLGRSSSILTVKSGDIRFHSNDYSKWNGIRIGILENNIWSKKLPEYARQKGFTFKIVVYKDAKKMFYDLQGSKNVDAILSNNFRRLENEWILDQIDAESFYIAVQKKNKDLLAKLDEAMALLEMNEPAFRDTLWQKYFSSSQTGTVIYTEQENAFIQDMKERGHKFTAVLNPDRYPISYYTPEGHRGFIKDIADEIIRRTGLDIEFLPVKTPEEYRDSFKDPKIDIIFDSKYDLREAEKNYLNLSHPYLSLSAFMLQNKNAGKDLNSLKKIVLIEGYRIAEKIRPLLPKDVQIQYCRTTSEAIDLVTSGECDGTCLHTSVAEYAVKNDPYDRLTTTLLLDTHINLSVGTRDSRNPLFTIVLNKAVASINNDFIIQTMKKYDLPRDNSISFGRMLRRHPVLVSCIPVFILIVVCVLLWRTLLVRRKAYRIGFVFDNMPFRYFFVDDKGKLLEYGYGSEQLNNQWQNPHLRTLDDVQDDGVRLTIKRMLSNALSTGKQQEEIYIEAGRIRLGMVSPVPKMMFGRPVVLGISRDITELQMSRDEAHRNEEYFRLTLRSIGDGVIATDKLGNVIMLNSVAERMMGVTLSEARGEPHTKFFKIINTEDGDELESPVLRTLRTGKTVEIANHTDLVSMDGTRHFHIADSSSPILDDKGNVLGAILVFRDVTEEYERQNEIQEELTNWEVAAKIAQIYHFKYDPKTKKVGGSKDLADIWPMQDDYPVAPKGWIIPEDYPEWNKYFTDVIEGKLDKATVDYRAVENGRTRYFHSFIRGASRPGGELIGLVQEYTSFMELQQRTNAWRTLWSTCLETMPVALFIKSADEELRYYQCNMEFAQFMGRSIEEVIGLNDRELLRNSEDAEECRRHDLMAIEQGRPLEFQETVVDSEGKTHHFRTVKVLSTDPDGRPILVSMSLDETEIYNRQQKLDALLEDWENAANIARVASYRLNSDMRVLSATERITDFWPILDDGVPISEELYLHPDDVAPYRKMYQSVFNGQQEQASMLCRVPQLEGMRYLRLFIKRNADRPNEISGLIQDVTVQVLEQKKRDALLRMWKNVIDTVPALFFVKNADDEFRYLQTNKNFCDQLDMESKDIIGKKEEEILLKSEEAEQNHKEDLEAMESGKRRDFVEQIHVKNGIQRQYQTVKVPSVDEMGRRILIGMSLDITDAQELYESRKIISTAFETLFTSDDLEGDMRVILKNICDFIGFDRAYICQIDEATDTLRMFTTYYPSHVRPLFNHKTFRVEQVSSRPWYIGLNNAIRNDVFHFDFSNQHDRDLAWYHFPLILEKAEEYDIRGMHLNYIMVKGKPWGSLGFISCGHPQKTLSKHQTRLLRLTAHIIELAITRQSIMEQLQSALSNALAADKAKNYFLSSMSHEIRTPLNAVIGFTDLLKDKDLDQPERMEYLNMVSESSHALLTLLNDILELSKLNSDGIKYYPVYTNMKEFVLELDAAFRPNADQKNLTLDFIVDSVPDLYLDQPSLRQILFNLIGNAIKFTHQGGVKVLMEYNRLTLEDGELILKVSDTGIGVVSEDKEKIFEPFSQISRLRGTNSFGAGTGLGLAIVKNFVEQQGGTLEMESEIGCGTTFTITLPNIALYSPSTNIINTNAFTSVSSMESKKSGGSEGSVPRVLLVDDSKIALDILSHMLIGTQVPFKKAYSGKEALQILEQESFDIILTDLIMPEMNGAELAEQIRTNPRCEKIKIFAMSTENDPVMYDKKLFDKVMLKPIIRKVLYDSIFGEGQNAE